MKFYYKIATGIIAFVFFNAAVASAGDAWRTLLWQAETYTKQSRIKIAKGLLEDVYEPLYAAIPNPKPSEREWVRKEQQDIQSLFKANPAAYNERQTKLIRSQEYCSMLLKDRLGRIVYPLRSIVNNSVSLPLREEVALWAETVYWITSDNNEIDNNFLCLENARVVDSKKVPGLMSPPDGGHDYWYLHTLDAARILNGIVIPYLKGEIKK